MLKRACSYFMFSRALECGLGGWDDWDREVYGWCDRNRSAEYLEERLGLERERKKEKRVGN